MLSSDVLHAESVQIDVIISQLLLESLIRNASREQHTLSLASADIASFWNGFERAEAFGKGLLLATLQSRFSSAHNSLSKGRRGGKENP